MALSWLKGKLDSARSSAKEQMSRYKNKTFMEATVAGWAQVAAADGSIDASEKQKMIGFIQQSDALSVFKMEEVIAAFQSVVSKFEFDFSIGKAEAMTKINKIKGDDAQSRLLVRVCCVIGASDGDFDEKEIAMVRDICRELGLDPADFDL